ncbi:hypothetical protein D3C79_700640 [compost metagenome]
MNRPAKRTQLPYRFHRLDAGGQAFVGAHAFHPGAADHTLAGHPAVALEVAGHTADGIVRVVPDIDVAVPVEVHRVVAEAAWHELRQPHGASVRALERQGVELLIPGQQQELTQLLAEELGPWRVVEAQRRQGVDHPVVAGIAAKKGFHADDCDNVLRRYAVLLLGTCQHSLVLTPEIHTASDTCIGDEHRPIVLPRFDPLGRARYGVEDRLLALYLTEHTHQLLRRKTIVAAHFANERGYLGRAVVFAGMGQLYSAEQAHRTDPRRTTGSPVTHCLHEIVHLIQTCAIHLRCVWIDIRTPNADSSVTNDVPP